MPLIETTLQGPSTPLTADTVELFTDTYVTSIGITLIRATDPTEQVALTAWLGAAPPDMYHVATLIIDDLIYIFQPVGWTGRVFMPTQSCMALWADSLIGAFTLRICINTETA